MRPKAVISINKEIFGRNDEIVIHVWFDSDFPFGTQLLIRNPSDEVLDQAYLKGKKDTTETFAFPLGEKMAENGKYSIVVNWHSIEFKKSFEYFDSRNIFDSSNYV